jgi:hypothetical protein
MLGGSGRINPELESGERCTVKKVLISFFMFRHVD